MKTEEIIDKFAKLTHSPQGKYAADEETYKELLARLPENDRPTVEPAVIANGVIKSGVIKSGVRKPAVVRHLWWRTSAAASVAIIICIGVAIACVVTFGGNIFTPPTTDDTRTETTTQDAAQTLVFNNEPLADIVATLAAAYDAEILIEESGLADYRLTATFTTDEPLDEVLSILAEAGGFSVERQGARFVIGE